MATEILNREQFAKDNIGLVYSFMDTYHIRYRQEEIVDILYVGFTKALNIYDSVKGEFSTVAYACMEHEYFAYCTYLKRVGRYNGMSEVSLNTPIGTEDDGELGDFIADKTVDVESEAMHKIFMECIEVASKKTLTAREQLILRALYDDSITLDSIAQKYGVTKQAIGQQRDRVIGKLKYYFRTHDFKSLLPTPDVDVENLLLDIINRR